jgi:hypothetical protein
MVSTFVKKATTYCHGPLHMSKTEKGDYCHGLYICQKGDYCHGHYMSKVKNDIQVLKGSNLVQINI